MLALANGDPIGEMPEGELFELLELAGGHGWGVAPAFGLVGYVDRRALELA